MKGHRQQLGHPTEIRRFPNGRLDPERTAELGAALRDAGIPT